MFLFVLMMDECGYILFDLYLGVKNQYEQSSRDKKNPLKSTFISRLTKQ